MNESQPLFATELFLLWHKDKNVIAVSDNEDTLAELMRNDEDYVVANLRESLDDNNKIFEGNAVATLGAFDIIENDTEKKYGFSEVYAKEDTFDITMFKHRLSTFPWAGYDAAVEELTENPGVWDEAKTPQGVFAHHCRYWQRNDDAAVLDSESAPQLTVFKLDDDLIEMLFRTGFKAKNILLTVES